MKFNKKKVLVASLAISLIAILSLGTLAWFSDSDEVTNKFHVAGGEDSKPDEIFSVDVMEAVDADEDGIYEYADDKTIGVGGTDEWTYEDITPNAQLLKRVSTLNSGSYDQWVRMKVTVSNELLAILGQHNLSFTSILKDMPARLTNGLNYLEAEKKDFNHDGRWLHDATVDVKDNGNTTTTFTFYYNGEVAEDQSVILFSVVHIPYQFTQQDMAALDAGAFDMVITGEAVQSDNTAGNARDAFALVEATQPFN